MEEKEQNLIEIGQLDCDTQQFLRNIERLIAYEIHMKNTHHDCQKRLGIYFELLKNGNLIYFRHFKGNWYKAKNLSQGASNGNTEQTDVIYEPLYINPKRKYKYYNREVHEFLSITDKEKYPQYDQFYRFATIHDLISQYGMIETIQMIFNGIKEGPYINDRNMILNCLVQECKSYNIKPIFKAESI